MTDQLSSVLLVHDDTELLDTLTRTFEARGYEVAIAATAFAAISRLGSNQKSDVIIAGWDAGQAAGLELYRWVLDHRPHLRNQFVFLAHQAPGEFDHIVRGRCLLIDPDDRDEIVRVTEAAAVRAHRQRLHGLSFDAEPYLAGSHGHKPSLLLVEDEPLQLVMIRAVLNRLGFAVTPVQSCTEAIAELATVDYDVILSDWYMTDGSGGDLYEWLSRNRPHLAKRCVFMSAANPPECARRAPGRPILPKGQDSPALFHKLKSIARSQPAPAW